MIILGALCGALTIFAVIVYADLCYKNHCIEVLELKNKSLNELKDFEISNILLEVIEYTDLRKSYKMMDIRDYCDRKIAELAQKSRTSQDHESND